jgi:hypothetical protein
MKHTTRRATALAAAGLLGAALAVAVPSVANAANPLPAPYVEDITAFDNGPGAADAAIDVEFDAPAPTHDATKVLVGYEAVLYDGPSLAHPVQHQSTDNIKTIEFAFTDLTYGTAYDVSIQALYDDNGTPGYSDLVYASDDASGVVPLHNTPPVTGLHARARASGTVDVTWTAPVIPAHTEPVFSYSLFASPELSGDISTPEDIKVDTIQVPFIRGTHYRLNGLRNGATYDIVVTTTYFSLTGGDNDPDVEVTPYGAPHRPSKLKVHFTGSTKAKISWTKAKSTAAAPVAGYRVFVNGKKVATLGKSTSHYTAHHIKKGKTYKVTVRAYNAHGVSSKLSVRKHRA